jgi:hypothetical protein
MRLSKELTELQPINVCTVLKRKGETACKSNKIRKSQTYENGNSSTRPLPVGLLPCRGVRFKEGGVGGGDGDGGGGTVSEVRVSCFGGSGGKELRGEGNR